MSCEVTYEDLAALAAGDLDETRRAEVEAHLAGCPRCRGRLAAYKVPKIIEFRDSLPTSIIGKVLRKTLREEEMKKSE